MSVREICVKSYVAWKESVAMTFSTNCDLAIECLDFRVATIVVRMMKIKVATSRFSNFDSAIPGLVAMLHCRTLSFFGLKGTCRRLVRIRVVGLKSFRALIGPARRSSSMHTSLMVLSYRCPWCQGAVLEMSIIHSKEFFIRIVLSKFFNLSIPCLVISTHKTESEWTKTFAFVHVITWSGVSVDLVHEGAVLSIGDTFRISVRWSNINLCVISKKYKSSSKFVFLFSSQFSV